MLLCSSVIWVFESSLSSSSSRSASPPPLSKKKNICIQHYIHLHIYEFWNICGQKLNKSIFQYQITPASSKQDPINTGRVFAAPLSDLYAHKTKRYDPSSIYHRKTKERIYFGPVVPFFGDWVFVIPSWDVFLFSRWRLNPEVTLLLYIRPDMSINSA